MSYPNVYSPVKVGHSTLKNRLVHLATLTQYAQNNCVTDPLIAYHRARAEGGCAMSIVEGMAVHPTSVPLRSVVTLFDERTGNDSLKRLAAAGEELDCRMLGQLWHVGRQQLWSPIHTPVGVSDQPDAFSWTVPHKADIALIEELCAAFIEAAARLQRCGFSGVELHGAHGYLLTQFISPWSNTRDDRYGGNLANRLRFIREIIGGIRQRCGESFIVGLKMPATEGVAGGIDLDEAKAITEHLVAQASPDYFAYSQGNFSLSLEDHNPNMSYRPGHFLDLHRALRPHAQGVAVMAIGRILDVAHGEQILSTQTADLIGLSRALIADPALAEKTRSGREDEVRPCIFCNLCWGEIHAGKPLLCVHNPKLPSLDESDWRPQAAPSAKTIVVVGAGPAGLETAWQAAAQGHRVTLFGRSSEVGGALRLDALLPNRAEVGKVVQFQLNQVHRYGVELRLGTEADLETILSLQADRVFLATGSRLRFPETLSTSETLYSCRELITVLTEDTRQRSGVAVLYDMDHTDPTYAFADLLAQRYEKLIILTPRVQLARSVPYTNAIGIYRRLAHNDVDIVTSASLLRYDNKQLTYANVFTGREYTIDNLSLLTYSTPRKAIDHWYEPLRKAGVDVHLLGDARSPRTLFSAVHEGHHHAQRLAD